MDHLEHIGINHQNLSWAPIDEFEVWETWPGRRDIKTPEGMSTRRVKSDQVLNQLQNGTLFVADQQKITQPRISLLVAPQVLRQVERDARWNFRKEMKEGDLPFQMMVDKAKGLPFDQQTYIKVAKELGIPRSYCLHFLRKNSVPFLATSVNGKERGWKGFICQTPFLTNSDFFISLAVSYDPQTHHYKGLLHFVLNHPRYDSLRHYVFATKHLVQHPLLLPIIIFTVADTHNRQQCQRVDSLVRTSFATSSLRHQPDDAGLEDFSNSLREASQQLELLQWCQTTISSPLTDFLQSAEDQITTAFGRMTPAHSDSDPTSELQEFFDNVKVGMEYQIPTRDRIELQIQHVVSRIEHEETQISLRQAQYGKQDAAAMGAISIITMVFLPATALASILSMELFFKGTHDGSRVRISRSFWIFLAIAVPLTLAVVGGWVFWMIWRDKPASQTPMGTMMTRKDSSPKQAIQKFIVKNAWKSRQRGRDPDEERTLLPRSSGLSSTASTYVPSGDGKHSYSSLLPSSPSYGTASRSREFGGGRRS